MQQSWFKDWFNSPYYHQLYSNRNDEEAALFINNLLSFLQPEASSRMLDVACGKGRHAMQMASKGYDVTGIDLSEESIAAAQMHEHEQLHFFTHDMREQFRSDYYHYVFNFFTSFGYFKTPEEDQRAIRSMTSALVANGILVIDYLNVAIPEKTLVPSFETKIGEVDFLVTRWQNEKHLFKKIDIEDHLINESFEFSEQVAKFRLHDFEQLLQANEMEITHVFGNYALEKFDVEQSPRLIIVAKKKI